MGYQQLLQFTISPLRSHNLLLQRAMGPLNKYYKVTKLVFIAKRVCSSPHLPISSLFGYKKLFGLCDVFCYVKCLVHHLWQSQRKRKYAFSKRRQTTAPTTLHRLTSRPYIYHSPSKHAETGQSPQRVQGTASHCVVTHGF